MTIATTFSWLVTVREAIVTTRRVYAATSDDALNNWQSGEHVSNDNELLLGVALTACPEQPVLEPLDALELCLERLELNNIDGSEDSTIDMARTAISFAKRGSL